LYLNKLLSVSMFAFWQNKKKPGGGAGLLKAAFGFGEGRHRHSRAPARSPAAKPMLFRRGPVKTRRRREARWDGSTKRNRFAEAASAMKLSKKHVKAGSGTKKSVTDARKK
jgi:hypothetical protein